MVKHEHNIEEQAPIHVGVQTKPRRTFIFILFALHNRCVLANNDLKLKHEECEEHDDRERARGISSYMAQCKGVG